MTINTSKRLPSEEMPWQKWHEPNAREETTKPIENITMCQLVERSLRKQGDVYPAIDYFGNKISRSKFLTMIDDWARMFHKMGVETDERVIFFAPFTPESAAIFLALNKIGACAVMLNFGSSVEALAKGLEGARFAVVADAVESIIAPLLRNNSAFKHVILLSINTDMPFFMRQAMSIKNVISKKKILNNAKNYITSREAFRRYGGYTGPVEVPCEPERPAIVTSSGGTSSKGYAKQVMDSNRAVISMMRQTNYNVLVKTFLPGTTCYTSLPPFISTSTVILFLLPLCNNMTSFMDPRVDPKVFTNNILKIHPQNCLIPGPGWVYFFAEIEKRIKEGRTPDLGFLNMPMMGGDGISVKDFRWMNGLLRKCGSKVGIFSGYGMSEMLSVLTVDNRMGYEADKDTQSVISVGNPIPGVDVAIMDKNGNELSYGERGEVCTKGSTFMLGYYNDIGRTNAALRDGWYRSGDLGSIDEDGNLFIYGRLQDCFENEDGTVFHPSDIEFIVNKDNDVSRCVVVNMSQSEEKPCFAVHVFLNDECTDTNSTIRRIDKTVHDSLRFQIEIGGYKIHRQFFKMSTALKIDRQYYKSLRNGYIKPEGEKMIDVNL